MGYWHAGPIWKGETCYIIGGGPSLLTQDKSLLEGRHLIVINSSYLAFPEAEFCVFSDMRWWCDHLKLMGGFKGTIVSTSSAASGHPRMVKMQRKSSPGLAEDRLTLMVKNTTLTAAINLAVHFAVAKIVLLGIDQKPAADGNNWHHAPHRWKPTANCWQRQQSDLPKIAEGLTAKGIQCVNASPGTALKTWPAVNLEDHLEPVACGWDARTRGQHIPEGLRQDAVAAA